MRKLGALPLEFTQTSPLSSQGRFIPPSAATRSNRLVHVSDDVPACACEVPDEEAREGGPGPSRAGWARCH